MTICWLWARRVSRSFCMWMRAKHCGGERGLSVCWLWPVQLSNSLVGTGSCAVSLSKRKELGWKGVRRKWASTRERNWFFKFHTTASNVTSQYLRGCNLEISEVEKITKITRTWKNSKDWSPKWALIWNRKCSYFGLIFDTSFSLDLSSIAIGPFYVFVRTTTFWTLSRFCRRAEFALSSTGHKHDGKKKKKKKRQRPLSSPAAALKCIESDTFKEIVNTFSEWRDLYLLEGWKKEHTLFRPKIFLHFFLPGTKMDMRFVKKKVWVFDSVRLLFASGSRWGELFVFKPISSSNPAISGKFPTTNIVFYCRSPCMERKIE